jgi:uncharacterized protein
MLVFHLIIVGAGPSGLATAKRMNGKGYKVALVDSGKHVKVRDRNDWTDLTHGHGGAGLFSDGKFSFFPSATDLWSLPNQTGLRSAYDWTSQLLNSYGLDTPPFPADPTAFNVGYGEWVLKDYPSDYLSLDARLELTSNLVEDLEAELFVETEVLSARYNLDEDVFLVNLKDQNGRLLEASTRKIVIATGRFGPLRLRELTGIHTFKRLEVGFRIEQPSNKAFFRDMKQLDPKLRFRDDEGDVEWRTFCACREGDAVLTRTQGLWTVSGHSDCPPTGRSNVGFNTRILDEALAERTIAPAIAAMKHKESHFVLPINDLLSGSTEALDVFHRVYGPDLTRMMLRGLVNLTAKYPEILDAETRLIGPTLEGVGWYPKVDGNLRLEETPAWVAGDACGLFRGIVAALISGHYAGTSVLRDLEIAEV